MEKNSTKELLEEAREAVSTMKAFVRKQKRYNNRVKAALKALEQKKEEGA